MLDDDPKTFGILVVLLRNGFAEFVRQVLFTKPRRFCQELLAVFATLLVESAKLLARKVQWVVDAAASGESFDVADVDLAVVPPQLELDELLVSVAFIQPSLNHGAELVVSCA